MEQINFIESQIAAAEILEQEFQNDFDLICENIYIGGKRISKDLNKL